MSGKKTAPPPHIPRRALILGLCLWPMAPLAHDGHGPAIFADALRYRSGAGQGRLDIRLTNTATQPAALFAVTVPGQSAQPLPRPVIVPPLGEAALRGITLPAGANGAVTLILDFGPEGTVPVLVTLP